MNLFYCFRRKSIACALTALLFFSTSANAQSKERVLHELNNTLINAVMGDNFSPVVASRIYVYPNIAFFEVIRQEDNALPSMAGKLNGLRAIPAKPAGKQIDDFIAASVAFSYVGQNLIGSEFKMEDWRKTFSDSVTRISTNPELTANSIQYGKLVADSIVAWTKRDSYMVSRGLSRYVIGNKPGSWQPTPLDYVQALEPHWNTIRPLTLRSADQFSPKEKLSFSMAKNSKFYKTMMDTYKIGKTLDSNRKAIALYWDDNPSVSKNIGHLQYFEHKISPAGHWMMIAQQAMISKNIPLARAAQAYAMTGTAMFDGFIACWDEKFKTNLIRPITIINRSVDKNWQPLIQTPPFPEFTSGHAVVSHCAATVLTKLLGDNFEFIDNTEIPFGQGSRKFKSFLQASAESSMSRVYGGIHYPETARISAEQGIAIGNYVVKLLSPSAN